ncbi:MAG TPA: ABC transporter permease subunit, partial [Petrotogaceae bacterium]|nr:ABC transporter permease subunit [Petrotogaceae bacterium]
YTIKTAFTDYGTGHLFTRDQAIQTLLTDPRFNYEPQEGKTLDFRVYVRYDEKFQPTEDFRILLYDNESIFVTEKLSDIRYDSKGNTINANTRMYKAQDDYINLDSSSYRLIRSVSETTLEPFSARVDNISAIEDSQKIRYSYFYSINDPSVAGNSAFYTSVLRQKYIGNLEISYDALKFRLSDRNIYRKFSETYKKYDILVTTENIGQRNIYKTIVVNKLASRNLTEKDGAFWDYDESGNLVRLEGYVQDIGTGQFEKIFKDPKITGPFIKIFIWTFTYAGLSVLFTFAIGLMLALALNDKGLRGRMVYRTLLILPWAIPAFISVLVWRNGFFNETYGFINKFVVTPLGFEPLKWLNDPFLAKVAVLIVNTWLGFPYMMTVTLGSLQSIPEELYEASSIDGASRFKQFWKITFPLLMVSVAPLLVMSFAFNFNNFVNIYLLTAGNPAMANTNTYAGETDILISYTYKLAFEGGRGQDFGFASAISLIIFVIVAGISYANFKFTKSFEEVSR